MFLSSISLLFLQIIVVATICPETAQKHHCCIASDLYPGKVLPTINRQHVEKFLQFHAPWTRQQDKYKKHGLASTADTQRTTHSKRKGKDYDFSFILLLLLLDCCSAQRASCLAIMYQPWYHVSTTLLQNVLLLF